MRVLDLFAGLEGWSEPFRESGHEVFSVDFDERFNVDLHADINELRTNDIPWHPDLILASPPCESFSVGSFRHHWSATATCDRCGDSLYRASGEVWEHFTTNRTNCQPRHSGSRLTMRGTAVPGSLQYTPKSRKGIMGRDLLRATLRLIDQLQPAYFIIENPRALMRKMPELSHIERRTVTYCQYGKHYMKPTDLFGGFPPPLVLNPPCKNGDPCHEAVSRGARTGTQGLGSSAVAAKIPYELAADIRDATEIALKERASL